MLSVEALDRRGPFRRFEVTEAEYRRAVAIAQRACRGWRLSREDWEEVEQDAAVEAWRTGSSTRIWWAAVDGARRISGVRRRCQPVVVQLPPDVRSDTDVEAEVLGRVMADQALALLPPRERRAVAATVLAGRTQADLAVEWKVRDSTVSRRRAAGLARLLSPGLLGASS